MGKHDPARQRRANKDSVKKLLFCCDINSETILLIIAAIVLHMGFIHLYGWIVFYCVYILVPHLILMILYFSGGFLLLLGVLFYARILIVIFPWIMFICLLGNVVYSIMLYVGQRCICETIGNMTTHNYKFHMAVAFEYYILGLIPGVNFVVTFYLMFLVADYLVEYCEET